MIYILNKNKIISYVVASFIVLGLFVFSSSIMPNNDVQILKVSANTVEQNVNNINNANNIKVER